MLFYVLELVFLLVFLKRCLRYWDLVKVLDKYYFLRPSWNWNLFFLLSSSRFFSVTFHVWMECSSVSDSTIALNSEFVNFRVSMNRIRPHLLDTKLSFIIKDDTKKHRSIFSGCHFFGNWGGIKHSHVMQICQVEVWTLTTFFEVARQKICCSTRCSCCMTLISSFIKMQHYLLHNMCSPINNSFWKLRSFLAFSDTDIFSELFFVFKYFPWKLLKKLNYL